MYLEERDTSSNTPFGHLLLKRWAVLLSGERTDTSRTMAPQFLTTVGKIMR